jgi:hypothetical protein
MPDLYAFVRPTGVGVQARSPAGVAWLKEWPSLPGSIMGVHWFTNVKRHYGIQLIARAIMDHREVEFP